MFNRGHAEQKSSVPRQSAMNFFNESQKSKNYLINKLNIALIEINSLVNKMDLGPRRETLKYLLSASSFEDPYQLELMQKTLDDEIAILIKQRGKLGFKGCITWSLCSLGVSFTNAVVSLTESKDLYGMPKLTMSNNLSIYAFVSSVIGGAAAIRAYIIESKIANLNNIKKIISKLTDDNQKLVSLLNFQNPDELDFRQDFFDKYILPGDRIELEKRVREELARPVVTNYTEWNPRESFIIPSRIGVASRS